MGELPEKSLILIEEDTGSVKSIYSQYLASDCALGGKNVSIITSDTPDEIHKQMDALHIPCPASLHIEETHATDHSAFLDHLTSVATADLVIVEQFALHFLDIPLVDFSRDVSRLVSAAKGGRQYLLLVDRGVLPARHEAVLRAMVAGVIQITTVTEGDKTKRYLNIPKMQGVRLSEKMLPFTVTDEGFLIDTRERHG